MSDFERLPTTIVPKDYTVDLIPDLDDFSFQGKSSVSLTVKKATNQIKLNSLDIEIHTAKYNDQEASKITYDIKNEAAVLDFSNEIQEGEGNLDLTFKGFLKDNLKGFYRSKYTDQNGAEKFCAVTQFESTDARRCFPCWDEPAVKSTFKCSLTVPVDKVALSNMPVVQETKVNDTHKLLQFDRSPIMSTYLLAFFVGESEYVEGETKDGIKVRVYVPVGKKDQGQFSLDMGIKSLEFYTDYFNVPYPLPKMDMIGLDDFSAGAMENWGLVTYRSNLILVDEKHSSMSTRQRVAIVVAHELAHQWFGNLVTMEWWTHLWLNEGFASFMEYLCTDSVHPEYHCFDQFVKDDFSMGMGLDAMDSSHPIEVPVNHPAEVDEIFDHISYCKGSSVIRMLHSWIGDSNFRTGMSYYLNQFKYQNAVTKQLWDALELKSKMPVEKVMSTWVNQQGFPLLKVKKVSSDKISVEQVPFSANGPQHKGVTKNNLWQVPIQFCNDSNPQEVVSSVVLGSQSEEFTVPASKWVKLNCGAVGFYRTHYDTEMAKAIDVNSLMTRDRLLFQADYWALAKAGYISVTEYLNVLDSYKQELDYSVLADILGNLSELGNIIRNMEQDDVNAFNKWKVDFLQHAKNSLGFEPKEKDTPNDSLLRVSVLSSLGNAGDAETVKWANDAFEKHMNGSAKIPGDLKKPVFSTVVRNSTGLDQLEQLITFWKDNSDNIEAQSDVERSVGMVKNPDQVKRVMDFITNDVRLSNQPFSYVVLCMGSLEGCDAVWTYIKNNSDYVIERFSGFLRQAVIGRTLSNYSSQKRYEEIKQFFKGRKIEGAERSIAQMLEKIQLKAKMYDRESVNIKNYFK